MPWSISSLVPPLRDSALTVGGQWWLHENYAAFDGRRTGVPRAQNLFNLSAEIDLEKAIGLEGASCSCLFQNHAGTNGHLLAGDEQFYDQLDASPQSDRSQISELWYEQWLLDKRLRVKAGKVDANNEFAYVENASDFLHGAFGNAPTIFLLPTYPDPACGVNVFVYPTERLYCGVAMYDGSAADGNLPGRAGPKRLLSGNAPLFWIGEVGLRYQLTRNCVGRIAAGYWYSSATFDEVDDLSQESVDVDGQLLVQTFGREQAIKGVDGFYLVWEQTLWRENPDDEGDRQGVHAFYQFGNSDPRVTIFQFYNGAGLTWTGFLNGRDADAVGMGVACSDLSEDPQATNFRRGRIRHSDMRGSETAINSFYQWTYSPNLSLSPQSTYIIPAAQSARYGSPLMLTLRVIVTF